MITDIPLAYLQQQAEGQFMFGTSQFTVLANGSKREIILTDFDFDFETQV